MPNFEDGNAVNYVTLPNPGRIQLLVDALRSGKYAQCRSGLAERDFRGHMSYCCLGVACEVAIANGVNVEQAESVSSQIRFNESTAYLPRVVQEWYGFTHADPRLAHPARPDGSETTAATLNDRGQPFRVIADAFERTYLSE